jgi:hypothetical protein
MSVLDEKIAALQAAVAQETTVEQSAATLIQGIPGMIADAAAKAQAAGATPAQLQALADLGVSIGASSGQLASAVQANTPAAVPVLQPPAVAVGAAPVTQLPQA